jgi:hypothetical protein
MFQGGSVNIFDSWKRLVIVLIWIGLGFTISGSGAIWGYGQEADGTAWSISKLGEWGTGLYNDVEVSGNYAFCAASGAGLDVIDISQPANPVKIANCSYVSGFDNGIMIIDVSSPGAPGLITFMAEPYRYEAFAVKNGYLYAAAVEGKFKIFDIANPHSPVEVGSCQSGILASAVAVGDRYAFISFMGIIYMSRLRVEYSASSMDGLSMPRTVQAANCWCCSRDWTDRSKTAKSPMSHR